MLDGLERAQALDLPDPLSGIPFRYLLLATGIMELIVSWLCLFTDKRRLSLSLMMWLTWSLAAYRVGLWTMGWPHPWAFVGGLADLLHASPARADAVLLALNLYPLAGSVIMLWSSGTKPALLPEPIEYLKVACSSCGGKTAFTTPWLHRTVPCPHCGATMTLQPAAAEVGRKIT